MAKNSRVVSTAASASKVLHVNATVESSGAAGSVHARSKGSKAVLIMDARTLPVSPAGARELERRVTAARGEQHYASVLVELTKSGSEPGARSKVDAADVGAGKFGTLQISPFKRRLLQIGTGEPGVGQIGVSKIGFHQPAIREIRISQLSAIG